MAPLVKEPEVVKKAQFPLALKGTIVPLGRPSLYIKNEGGICSFCVALQVNLVDPTFLESQLCL